MWWDTHFHLDSFHKKGVIPEILSEAEQEGVSTLTAIGGGIEANQLAVDTATRYPDRLCSTVGFDRDLAPGWDGDLSPVALLASETCVVGIGECGLDYFHMCGSREEQHRLFEANLDLALNTQKPVIVHSREAEEDTLHHLRSFSQAWTADRPCAVLHCFTGDVKFARQLVDLNILISFSGILTFKNASSIREAAQALPDEALLVETDSPYLAPEPYRGQRNQPARVRQVGEFLADLRNTSYADMARITSSNASRLFQRS